MSEEKSVFGPYSDGSGESVYGDPQEIYRGLQRATGGQLRKFLRDARQRGPDDAEGDTEEDAVRKATARAKADLVAFPAIERLIAAARDAFDLKPFDKKTGKGATEALCNAVLTQFFAFLSTEKKSTDS